MSEPDPGFELIEATEVATSSFLRVEELRLLAPSGEEMRRTVVRHPGAVAVVPLDEDDFVLVRQYRAPIGKAILEIPAGKLDMPGEDRLAAAGRELEEEVGLRASNLEHLTTMWTAPGFSDERMWIYLATDLEAVAAKPHGPEEEAAEIVRVSRDTAGAMLADDRFDDAKTIVGLHAALARLT